MENVGNSLCAVPQHHLKFSKILGEFGANLVKTNQKLDVTIGWEGTAHRPFPTDSV